MHGYEHGKTNYDVILVDVVFVSVYIGLHVNNYSKITQEGYLPCLYSYMYIICECSYNVNL